MGPHHALFVFLVMMLFVWVCVLQTKELFRWATKASDCILYRSKKIMCIGELFPSAVIATLKDVHRERYRCIAYSVYCVYLNIASKRKYGV